MAKGFNMVQLMGNVGQDIELRHTNSGTAVTTLRLAVNERAKVNGEWGDVTNWFDVVCWGKTAELCGQYLDKGSSVFVKGRLSVRSYEDKSGQKRTKTEVIADEVIFTGTQRDQRSDSPAPGQYGGGPDYDSAQYYNKQSQAPKQDGGFSYD